MHLIESLVDMQKCPKEILQSSFENCIVSSPDSLNFIGLCKKNLDR